MFTCTFCLTIRCKTLMAHMYLWDVHLTSSIATEPHLLRAFHDQSSVNIWHGSAILEGAWLGTVLLYIVARVEVTCSEPSKHH